jgi:hypothetical protein
LNQFASHSFFGNQIYQTEMLDRNQRSQKFVIKRRKFYKRRERRADNRRFERRRAARYRRRVSRV